MSSDEASLRWLVRRFEQLLSAAHSDCEVRADDRSTSTRLPRTEFACPMPDAWVRVHRALKAAWERSGKLGPPPPWPLILGGWALTTTEEKAVRWAQQLQWAADRKLSHLIPPIAPIERVEFGRYTGNPNSLDPPYSSYANTTPRVRPTLADERAAMGIITEGWNVIAGADLAALTRPRSFTGRRRRRLVVEADYGANPPWGSWQELESLPGRRSFTELRAVINAAISPHAVDHIDFVPRS